VISGASTGIGRHAAEHLASLGYCVFAGVRKASDGEPLKAAGCVPIILDVTKDESVKAAAEEVKQALAAQGQELVALVNNAGAVGTHLPMELETLDNARFLFEVNCFGIMTMYKHFTPLLRELSGGGARIVNVGSAFGHLSMATMGVYCMSKHAVEAITGCTRPELSKWGISVSTLNPGYVQTNLAVNSTASRDKVLAELEQSLPAEQQAYYPSLFDKEKRELDDAKMKAAFKSAPKPAQTTTPAIVHAISSSRPQPAYAISWLHPTTPFPSAALAFRFKWLVPTATFDWLIGMGDWPDKALSTSPDQAPSDKGQVRPKKD